MLFFDDQRLFARKGFERRYGEPNFIPDSVYTDPNLAASGGTSIWQASDGRYHLFYQGFDRNGITETLAAVSDDCIHWLPRNEAASYIRSPRYPNQLIDIGDAELAGVYVDRHDIPERRLKAMTARYQREELSVADEIYVSGDGYSWTLWNHEWSDRRTEPGAGCFYSDVLGKYIVVARSGWGRRQLCVRPTADWSLSEPSYEAIQIDSIDSPDLETYGMPSFPYKGMYIGFLWMYHVPYENGIHYFNGKMTAQLCYSLNGLHWQRSLRTDFIGNDLPLTAGMVFPTAVTETGDGSLLITASCTPNEHGHFSEEGHIITFRLREDGFIRLCADDVGSLCTRQLLVQGRVFWNLQAEHATVAVLDSGSRPIEGMGHEDCVPFSGDSVSWEPTYRNGRTLASLEGKVVVLELRLRNGSVYSYHGDFRPLMNTEAMRYEKFGHV